METTTFKIFTAVAQLPDSWDTVAHDNAFLQTSYLKVLEDSAPTNMQCFYLGIFDNTTLIGVALAQYLNLNKLESFGERDKCLKTYIRNFIFKNFASHVLFLGNNMITGQNGYAFNTAISFQKISALLVASADEIIAYFKKRDITIHIVSFKDFYQHCADELKQYDFATMYEFNTQPNMIFELSESWNSNDCYVGALSKKYRDQYKRAHKKFEGIETRELSLEAILANEERIYELYYHVAKNAPFNTFFLAKNHFSSFKKQCGDRFVLCGYYLGDQLVGFHTLLLNGSVLETYFLGYDETLQKQKMLYLNMLYDMIDFSIKKKAKQLVLARTALEIKSSVGAKAVPMFGYIKHRNGLLNFFMKWIFNYLQPEIKWQEPHPFH